MLDWSQCPAVESSPEKVGGEWLFKTTRIPVRALFENLEGGARVDDFLEWFPGVTREQVEQVIAFAEESRVAHWQAYWTRTHLASEQHFDFNKTLPRIAAGAGARRRSFGAAL
jgi:uncharacterized protein (DUF433 family)